MKYSPYSFSKINTYSCNRKFKYNYIDKVKQQPQNMEPLLKGGAVHHILEHHPEKSTHKLAPKYQHIADKFLKSKLGLKYLSKDSIREFDFGLTKELTPTEYKDKDALFRGSIDFMYNDGEKLVIIDWKSGKIKDQKWQDYTQLNWYAIYFFQKYPKLNQILISYVYIEHDNYENPLLLDRKYLDNYINDLTSKIHNIEQDTEFSKNETKLCDWCNYQQHCINDI